MSEPRRIEGYERELAERDRLDAEMDMLMAGMNARIRELERQLAASGGPRPGAQGGWAQPYGLAPPGGALGTVEEAGDVEEGAGPGAEAGPGAGASGAGPRWAEARDGAGGAAAMPAGPLGGLEGCVVESATGFERELGAGTGAGHSEGPKVALGRMGQKRVDMPRGVRDTVAGMRRQGQGGLGTKGPRNWEMGARMQRWRIWATRTRTTWTSAKRGRRGRGWRRKRRKLKRACDAQAQGRAANRVF